MDTTGSYSSFLDGKVERPHQTISQLVRAMLLNSGQPPNTWCYCAKNAADIYRYIYHSALTTSPYEAWYKVKPTIADLCVWGCVVYVKVPSPKKSEDRVVRGYFMGFTKSRLLIRWLDPNSQQVKHAFAVKFDEHCTPMSTTDQFLLAAYYLLIQLHPSTYLMLVSTLVTNQHLIPLCSRYILCYLHKALLWAVPLLHVLIIIYHTLLPLLRALPLPPVYLNMVPHTQLFGS
jgi:hypothetical protein